MSHIRPLSLSDVRDMNELVYSDIFLNIPFHFCRPTDLVVFHGNTKGTKRERGGKKRGE